MIGYNDNFSSIGDSNNFAIFDNLRVESLNIAPVQLLAPALTGKPVPFQFRQASRNYSVQWTTKA